LIAQLASHLPLPLPSSSSSPSSSSLLTPLHRYLTYGEEKWQADTVAALEAMELYSEEAKNGFRHTLGEGRGAGGGRRTCRVLAMSLATVVWCGGKRRGRPSLCVSGGGGKGAEGG
jgi:hypothetical protein